MIRERFPIQPIPRLDRATLGELILRNGRSLRPRPVCWHCQEPGEALFSYGGKILCLRDMQLASAGRLR